MENEKDYSESLWKAIKDACYQINVDEGAFERAVLGGFTPRKVHNKLQNSCTIEDIMAEIEKRSTEEKRLYIGELGPDTIFAFG